MPLHRALSSFCIPGASNCIGSSVGVTSRSRSSSSIRVDCLQRRAMLLLRQFEPLSSVCSRLKCLRAASTAAASAAAHNGAQAQPWRADPPDPSETDVSRFVTDPTHAAKLAAVMRMPLQSAASPNAVSTSEREFLLAAFRLHNASMNFAGHMIKARVLEVDKRKVTLDAGVKIAKIAVSDITPDCILTRAPAAEGETPRAPGPVRPGDVVQVYLEHEETPEGDMMVSAQQAAVKRRVTALWKELAERQAAHRTVRGRILNSVAGGFAVGVAGLVCFLPGSGCSRATAARIGDLQEFRIVSISKRSNIVLADARLDAELRRIRGPHHGHGQGQQTMWRRQQQQQQQQQQPQSKPDRPMVREADRLRKEILQGQAPAPTVLEAGASAAFGEADMIVAGAPAARREDAPVG